MNVELFLFLFFCSNRTTHFFHRVGNQGGTCQWVVQLRVCRECFTFFSYKPRQPVGGGPRRHFKPIPAPPDVSVSLCDGILELLASILGAKALAVRVFNLNQCTNAKNKSKVYILTAMYI
jgi:hypothetical protein